MGLVLGGRGVIIKSVGLQANQLRSTGTNPNISLRRTFRRNFGTPTVTIIVLNIHLKRFAMKTILENVLPNLNVRAVIVTPT